MSKVLNRMIDNHAKSHTVFLSVLLITFSSQCCANNLSAKIVGGFTATRGEFPAFAGFFIIELNEVKFQCGGCYIRRLWILTAGHCLYNRTSRELYAIETILVRMGMTQLNEYAQERRPVKLIVHGEYIPKPKNKRCDIGLVKIEHPFKLVAEIVNLARLNTKREISRDVAVVGFGRLYNNDTKPSNQMQVVHLTVWRKKADLFIIKDQTPKGACFGDSGGPLYLRRNKVVIGLVSAGICVTGLGYYINVRCYHNWMRKNMLADGSTFQAKIALYAFSFLLPLINK